MVKMMRRSFFLFNFLFLGDAAVGEECRAIVAAPGEESVAVSSAFWRAQAVRWTWETLGSARNVSGVEVWREAEAAGLTRCCEAPKRLYGKIASVESLCRAFFGEKNANPFAFAFFASRHFGGGARSLVNQWARVAFFAERNYTGGWVGSTLAKDMQKCDEKCVARANKARPYPFAIAGIPFLAGFDAVVTELPMKKSEPWGTLSTKVVVFAQSAEPHLVYTSNSKVALRRCLVALVRPAEMTKTNIVVYVSSQTPRTMDSEVRPTSDLLAILNSRNVAKVFAVNAVFAHPKLKGSPMGFHSGHVVLRGPDLLDIAKDAKPWHQRLPLVQACFNSGYADRRDAKSFVLDTCHTHCRWCNNSASDNPHFNKLAYWKDVSRYQFAISPWGNGKECGRSYELLVLGTVPIMHRFPGLAPGDAYEGFPVVIVDSWEEITPQNLAIWSQRLGTFFESHDGRMPLDLVSVAYQHRRMRNALLPDDDGRTTKEIS